MIRAAVIDLETTGLDPLADHIVEIGAVIMDDELGIRGMHDELVFTSKTIPSDVSGLNGITNLLLERFAVCDQQTWFTRLLDFLRIFDTADSLDFIVAHNGAFDFAFPDFTANHAVLPPQLCTKRLAQHLFPEAPNHRLQTLKYYLNLTVDDLGVAAHRSLGDCLVTAALLGRELRELSERGVTAPADILAFEKYPILLRRWWFGKYYGKDFGASTNPLDEIGLANWALNKQDFSLDADQRYTLQTHARMMDVALRRAAAGQR